MGAPGKKRTPPSQKKGPVKKPLSHISPEQREDKRLRELSSGSVFLRIWDNWGKDLGQKSGRWQL